MSTGGGSGVHAHTLNEFLSMTREKLDSFERHWREQVAAGNVNFPVSPPLGDWEGQFYIFDSDEANTDGLFTPRTWQRNPSSPGQYPKYLP